MSQSKQLAVFQQLPPFKAFVPVIPYGEYLKIGFESVIPDRMSGIKILTADSPTLGYVKIKLLNEIFKPRLGEVIVSIYRPGMKISVRINRGIFSIHFLCHNDSFTIKNCKIRKYVIILAYRFRPWKVFRSRVFNIICKQIKNLRKNLLNRFIIKQFAFHSLSVRENYISPFIITCVFMIALWQDNFFNADKVSQFLGIQSCFFCFNMMESAERNAVFN